MGCFGLFGRKRIGAVNVTEKGDSPRPLHHDSFISVEKPLLTTGRSGARPTAAIPPALASIRPTANPKYSAYSGVADGAEPSDGELRYRGTSRSSPPSTGTSKSDEDGDACVRARKTDEARRKAEQEEQERRDFFQMM